MEAFEQIQNLANKRFDEIHQEYLEDLTNRSHGMPILKNLEVFDYEFDFVQSYLIKLRSPNRIIGLKKREMCQLTSFSNNIIIEGVIHDITGNEIIISTLESIP